MTFPEALIASGYYFQPECGAYCKEDSKGFLHSYLQDPDDSGDTNTWNYEKYYFNKKNDWDEIVTSQRFSLD